MKFDKHSNTGSGVIYSGAGNANLNSGVSIRIKFLKIHYIRNVLFYKFICKNNRTWKM